MNGAVIVTGAAGGIGREIVRRLLEEQIRVLLVDVDPGVEAFAESCCRDYGEQLVSFQSVDITDWEQVKEMVEQVNRMWGDVRYLVNNAVYSVYEPFLEITPDSWRKVIDVGLTGYFYCSQAFAACLVREKRPGRIVNMASINSFAVEQGVAHYASVKGAIVQLTKAMAVELAPYGIHVNAVAPGLTETEKNQDIFRTEPFASQIAKIPYGRSGKPREIANIIAFLLMSEHYMIGQTLLADGGLLSGLD